MSNPALRWFSPALEIFTRSLGSLGINFDILYTRTDCIYLRQRWLGLRDADARAMASKVLAVNDALDLHNLDSTDYSKSTLQLPQADLSAYRTTIQERNAESKFAAYLYLSERSTKKMFPGSTTRLS